MQTCWECGMTYNLVLSRPDIILALPKKKAQHTLVEHPYILANFDLEVKHFFHVGSMNKQYYGHIEP